MPDDSTGGTPLPAPATIIEPAAPAPVAGAVISGTGGSPGAPVVPEAPSGAPPAPEIPAAEPAAPAAPARPAITEAASLLEAAGAPEKPAELPTEPAKPADGDAAAADAAAAAAAAEPIKYEPLNLPDGVELTPERIEAFDAVIAPHRLPGEARQQLAELHIAEMQRYAEGVAADQWRVFGETQQAWQQRVLADPELGGAGHQTAMKFVAQARDELVAEADRADFADMLRISGVGNHPAMLRLLYRAGRRFAEPSPAPPPHNPPPDIGKRPAQGRFDRGQWYDHDKPPG